MTLALEVRNLAVSYGKLEVLHGVSLELQRGSSLVVLGHNGAGKSTLLRALFGLARPAAGRIFVEGVDVTGVHQGVLIRAGVAFVPQGDAVFRDLTTEQNLRASLVAIGTDSTRGPELAYELFPMLRPLRHRQAGLLSGGERRILGVAMAAVRRPRLLLLDEPSIGLSPSRTEELFQLFDKWRKSQELSILIAEQNVITALKWMERALVIRAGHAHWVGSTETLSGVGEVGIARLL